MKRNSACVPVLILALFVSVARAAGAPVPELRLGKPNTRLVRSAFVMTHSPDGKRFAVTTYDGVVNVIDATVPRVLRTFKAPGKFPRVEYLGEWTIAVGGEGGRIAFWDSRTGRQTRVLREGGDDIMPMAASRDGTRLAFSAFDSSISVIDAATGGLIAAFPFRGEFKDNIMELEFSPDARRLASASMAGDLTVWDLDKSTLAWTFDPRTGKQEMVSSGVAGPHYGSPDRVTKIVWSTDGRSIAVDGPEQSVLIVDAESGKTVTELKALTGMGCGVESLVFAPDGRSLFIGHSSGEIRRIDLASGRVMFSVMGPGRIDGISVDPDGKTLRTLEHDGFVVIRDAATGRTAREGMARELWSAAFTKDGTLLAAGANDGSIDLFEMPSGKFLRRLDSRGKSSFRVIFSPDDRMLAATDLDSVRLWDPRTGATLRDIKPEGGRVLEFAFSADSRAMFLFEYNSISEWDPRRGARVREFTKVSDYLENLTVSPDGRYLAAGSLYGRLYLWDRVTGKEIFRKPDGPEAWTSVQNVAFAANGHELVGLLSRTHELLRFSIPDGKVLEKVAIGQCFLGTLPSPGGLAFVSKENCKRSPWTIKAIGKAGKLETLHRDFWGGAPVVGVSPDGRRVITSADDGVMSVWRAPAGGKP